MFVKYISLYLNIKIHEPHVLFKFLAHYLHSCEIFVCCAASAYTLEERFSERKMTHGKSYRICSDEPKDTFLLILQYFDEKNGI